jgi:CRISPR/Cas system-associated exonuclease Cas4 (RecB family)
VIAELTSRADWTSTLKISKSQLQAFVTCPRKFFYQYVNGQAWEFMPPALPFGRAIHAAGAYFYGVVKATGEKPELDAVLDEFRAAWALEGADPTIRWDVKNTVAGLESLGLAMLKTFHAETSPRQIEAIEYPFAVSLPGLDVQLVGIIDLIESDDDGRLIVSELKTAAKKMSDSEAENKLDGMVYAYAMHELGHATDDGVTLVRIDVLTKTKEPALQQMFVTKEAGDYRKLERWVRVILRAIAALLESDEGDEGDAFYPVFGWGCKTCQFQTACRKWVSA